MLQILAYAKHGSVLGERVAQFLVIIYMLDANLAETTVEIHKNFEDVQD